MITREQISSVMDHPVCDAEGNKIGDAKHVFLDDATGQPEWVSVKTGLFGTSESFVPIRDASVVEDHLEVPYPKDKVKDAPNVDVDAGGHLSEQEEHRLYEHYGIAWDDAWQQANQPGEGGWAHTGTGGMPTPDATGDMSRSTGTGVGEDDAMTRSEERMRVGTERREAGRARLRKYVVTEEVQRTVPVRREEVRVEREPITDANRDAAMSGHDIGEAEHEVTLHEERPVVETEAVPVERVRLSTEEHTDEETVRGRIRKEHIDTDGVDDDEEGRHL
ncbi:YsnF/AvaK domain-containing protein [Streptomyces resistomycificus]|uniref:Photosystem reaction center subunit H n=1 Tax=Streptomyces resistomycificus TaxID=67356 RepID=A0A0L8L4L5_9ACTN|nr:YsnF/AvaK domain-containing protein [Streptomyces resistomycificus]KOG33026.1 photosystem reaction center subunit H [Streptomyces resistomycificus]KUN94368.1 photosystem reaction center subunit H [Streptomyces resistomycificus]